MYTIALNINYNLTALTLVFVEIRIQQGLPHTAGSFLQNWVNVDSELHLAAHSTTSTGTPLDSAADVLAAYVLCALNCAVSTPAQLSTCRSLLASVFANRLVQCLVTQQQFVFLPSDFLCPTKVLF